MWGRGVSEFGSLRELRERMLTEENVVNEAFLVGSGFARCEVTG